jgi:hypothetical protein
MNNREYDKYQQQREAKENGAWQRAPNKRANSAMGIPFGKGGAQGSRPFGAVKRSKTETPEEIPPDEAPGPEQS